MIFNREQKSRKLPRDFHGIEMCCWVDSKTKNRYPLMHLGQSRFEELARESLTQKKPLLGKPLYCTVYRMATYCSLAIYPAADSRLEIELYYIPKSKRI